MKTDIKLSYILTTYNKIEYLKVTLPFLISSCQPDEEIVIVDGGSTDGTDNYLKLLKKEGKIHQFISERDAGEAHGTNKAVLMAKGELIKIITDDDAFYFKGIQECRDYLLKNSEIDIIAFDGLVINTAIENASFIERDAINDFRDWKLTKKPFLFSGLSLLFRKSSIPLLGLFSNNFKIVDFEYTLRVTSLPVKMAWYTGLGYVNIANGASNSAKFWTRLKDEYKVAHELYLKKSKSLDTWKSKLVELRDFFYTKQKNIKFEDFSESFIRAERELMLRNRLLKNEIIY